MKQADKFILRLYVTGMTPRSTRAIHIVRAVCEEHLSGQYDLEIVDVYQQPSRIQEDQIFAIPTLVKYQPIPLRRIIGDMSSKERLMHGLGIHLAS
ncbi:MAG: circadian clock KaiB family protein [Pseudomonadota bacterium]